MRRSQHKQPTRFKTSQFDTGVIILQNEKARAEWPVSDEVVVELRAAFASKHEAESEARRAHPPVVDGPTPAPAPEDGELKVAAKLSKDGRARRRADDPLTVTRGTGTKAGPKAGTKRRKVKH
jgi:hypothetical protein